MAGDKPGFAPSAASVIGAQAAALDQIWGMLLDLWRTVAETAYLEQLELKRRATNVFLHPAEVTRAGDVVPDLTVSAVRLPLDGGPATPVTVHIDKKRSAQAKAAGDHVAKITVSLDAAPRGAYRLEFRAGSGDPQIRIVNFGV